ncbi:scavenger receptor cysteine-rich type 1 protein M160 isoform X2 [Toxotes jaculatrix]|uniref:scavenger receptor cysteine-rich type 1 protein M160 isoform X2 n=1 Tax=Toxotes jaculatrix TaxID=941984 RepID=UPI001B3B1731|nr:scavenger receptor cysteine-rich type 1 protein M160 isoform X2 [Toxotes jaculatrix]
MMWFLLLLSFIFYSELVILHIEGENRIILRNGNNPCEGHAEVYYNNQRGYVGDKYWDKNTETVLCKSTHCGTPKPEMTKDVQRDTARKVWLNELRCSGNESNLWNCTCPGWGISSYRKHTVKKITCSNKIEIGLDSFQCAGAVRYSINGKMGYFCNNNWGKNQADILCQNLDCGKSKQTDVHQWMGKWNDFEKLEKMIINCPSNLPIDNLWQCVTKNAQSCTPATVICEDHSRLQLKGSPSNVCSGQLEREVKGKWEPFNTAKEERNPDVWCNQMYCGTSVSDSLNSTDNGLKCTDNVSVVLLDGDKPSKCYGAVHINVSGSRHSVCGSTWTEKEAEVVCKELNCGKLIHFEKAQKSKERGIMDNVNCLGSESSLWHCQAKHNDALECSTSAYVTCADSVNVTLEDGPGKCAGRVEILYKGTWKLVDTNSWTKTNSHVVCKQMNCGNAMDPTNSEKFTQGSVKDFLTQTLECKPNTATISECFTKNPNNRPNKEAVGITCSKNKLLFLDGENPCSGKVGIEQGGKTFWLSGSNKTWNQEAANSVCQQKHCGIASNFSAINSTGEKVWNESYNCSPNTTPLFECKTTTNPPDDKTSIAEVTCSGTIKVNLTNKCWGNVMVCLDGECGGVCADSWTSEQSMMLCKSLNCGEKVLRDIKQAKESRVTVKSLHFTKHTKSLAQSNFVKSNGGTCKPAHVVCSGCVKPKFTDSKDKCSGNVEIYYEGDWLPVCSTALQNKEAQDVICGELECGQAISATEYFGPRSKTGHVISQLQCSLDSKLLKACNFTVQGSTSCIPATLQCTDWARMKVSETCEGAVSVYTNKTNSAVSRKGWTESEGTRLCQDLNCGNYSKEKNSTFEKQSFWNSCGQGSQGIWDCKNLTSPSPQEEQLSIICQDKPNITLTDDCHGIVKINGMEVCGSHWSESYAHLVCQQQDCSNALFSNFVPRDNKQQMYYVSCSDDDYELGQCRRVSGTCDKAVSVYCVNSIEFDITEECRIKVKYGDSWHSVYKGTPEGDTKLIELCVERNCAKKSKTIKKSQLTNTKEVNISLECTANHMDIRHCVTKVAQRRDTPEEIQCPDYVKESKNSKTPVNPPTVPIILGVALFLVLLVVIIVAVRIWIVRRNQLRMPSRKEVEFESGDYEDVTSKENEMEDISRHRFRSESEVVMENDGHSISSLPYDDIDEVAESQPLTRQATTAGTSRDNNVPEGALDQRDDGVTYEVDDPQGSYDDIEPSPETTQTKAEVHDSPKTPAESDTVAPPDLVQGEMDYLVPGQDG